MQAYISNADTLISDFYFYSYKLFKKLLMVLSFNFTVVTKNKICHLELIYLEI